MGGTKNGWFTMESANTMDDLVVPPFQETSIYIKMPFGSFGETAETDPTQERKATVKLS